jgi:trans-2,3-dihydro-3-hydroxyanthranilate isomerase
MQLEFVTGAWLTAPQPLSRGPDLSPELIAAACALAADDIDTRHHKPCAASCGTTFIFAELTTRRALEAAQPRAEAFSRDDFPAGANGIHLYLRDGADGVDIRGGCSPRCSASPRIQQRAAPMPRWQAYWQA